MNTSYSLNRPGPGHALESNPDVFKGSTWHGHGACTVQYNNNMATGKTLCYSGTAKTGLRIQQHESRLLNTSWGLKT